MKPSLVVLVLSFVLAAGCSSGAAAPTDPDGRDGRAAVTVDGAGFHPNRLQVTAGRPVTVTFRRTTDQTCATKVVFPSLHLSRDLPLNRPVAVRITPTSARISFACGMGMFEGSLVAR